MKRFGILLIVCVALFAALTGTAQAADAPLTKEQAVIHEAKRVYNASRYTASRRSFAGWCGLMTSHQLYNMGINESLIVNDGNRQFDYYKSLKKTTGGYYINAYAATDYSLEDALNVITNQGSRDAYNLLVGFQWTNTDAGRRYGHACVVNAIIDGTVYFTESFYTSVGGAEGNVAQCSIARFAELFSGWTVFEGVIDFGTGQYADSCRTYPTNLYVRTRFDSMLRTQPCVMGQNGCTKMRSLIAGELLKVSAICQEPETGMLFYRVEDGEGQGYIAAGVASMVQYNEGNLEGIDIQTPGFLETGECLSINGSILAKSAMIGDIEVIVSDLQGNPVFRQTHQQECYRFDFSGLNKKLEVQKLENGFYRVQVYANAACKTANSMQIETGYVRELVYEKILQVAETPRNVRLLLDQAQQQTQPQYDGWVMMDGRWHRYEKGIPCAGWSEHMGVRYYLDAQGAVTTGWAVIDGVKLYFSPTGALCTGWLATAEGTVYLQENGGLAMGWQTIEGHLYFFEDNNYLLVEAFKTYNDVRYEIQPDGRAIPTSEEAQ